MRRKNNNFESNKIKYFAIGILVIIMVVVIYFVLFKTGDGFYVNGEKKFQMTKEVEFGDSVDISPETLNLVAKKGDKHLDISYEKPDISELKTYEIKYKAKGISDEFVLKLNVKDTTAPVISGIDEYEIVTGEKFTAENLDVVVTDNYDKKLIEKIQMDKIDTSKAGVNNITLRVKDSSGNEGKMKIKVTVSDKVSAGSSSDVINTNRKIKVVANPNDITVMLNKKWGLPDGWEPSDLVNINSNYGGVQYLREEAAMQWEKLRVDAINDGVVINVVSSYRSQSYQENLYNYYMSFDATNAPYYSAYPRTSEHEAGLAIDISYDGALHDDLQNSLVGSWMNKNGWKYGWVMRYPQGKEGITGYIFEPWHYRYVGRNLAEQLHNSGMTMEEYYE